MRKIKFRIAAYTDSAGKSKIDAPRNGNEDNMFVCSDLSFQGKEQYFIVDKEECLGKYGCLMVVADGMGGMNAGEVASEIAIDVVKESFAYDTLDKAVLKTEKNRARFMESVVVSADEAIKRHAKVHKECDGMGSTIVMAWLYDGKVTVTWCGDSRAYLYRDTEGLRQISKDLSYVQGLVDEGKITMDEAFDHPYNNVITRSLGDPCHKAKPDSITVPVFKGDIILVNSDGLSGVLRDSEMEELIKNNREDMNGCRMALWNAAEKAGWYDNVTAILCEVVDGPDYDPKKAMAKSIDCSDDYFCLKISKRVLKLIVAALLVGLIGITAVLYLERQSKSGNDNNEPVVNQKDSTSCDAAGENNPDNSQSNCVKIPRGRLSAENTPKPEGKKPSMEKSHVNSTAGGSSTEDHSRLTEADMDPIEETENK